MSCIQCFNIKIIFWSPVSQISSEYWFVGQNSGSSLVSRRCNKLVLLAWRYYPKKCTNICVCCSIHSPLAVRNCPSKLFLTDYSVSAKSKFSTGKFWFSYNFSFFPLAKINEFCFVLLGIGSNGNSVCWTEKTHFILGQLDINRCLPYRPWCLTPQSTL